MPESEGQRTKAKSGSQADVDPTGFNPNGLRDAVGAIKTIEVKSRNQADVDPTGINPNAFRDAVGAIKSIEDRKRKLDKFYLPDQSKAADQVMMEARVEQAGNTIGNKDGKLTVDEILAYKGDKKILDVNADGKVDKKDFAALLRNDPQLKHSLDKLQSAAGGPVQATDLTHNDLTGPIGPGGNGTSRQV